MFLNDKHKTPAFTLSEIIVVIILTSIVVGLSFSVLTLVQKHMYGIQNNFNRNTALSKLEQSLWLDFNTYSRVTYNVSNNKLVFNTEIDAVTYDFTNTNIVKGKDTFDIVCEKKTFFLNGSQVKHGYIDALKLEMSKTFQNKRIFIFRQNDATFFMN